jgi:hypothetical protein
MVFANRFVSVANANMPRARSTRDLPVVPPPLIRPHRITAQQQFAAFLFFFALLYLPTVIQWEMTGKREKGEDETTHPEMLLDPVTLFRLIDARSTSS